MSTRTDLAVSILNGAVGRYLAQSGNPLAIEMALHDGGRPVALDPASLARAFPAAGPRVVVLAHGLMANEHLWAFPDGSDYGRRLARDHGLTPLYLRYNSGLPIADNGAALDRLLDAVVAAWPVPVEEIVLLGFSMGGLVLRAAFHAAATRPSAWLARVRRVFYVATPHLGTPLERAGRLLGRVLGAIPDPYAQLGARLVALRSDGIQDLGDPAHPLPLLPGIDHHMIAGARLGDPRLAFLLGDLMVTVRSATDDRLRAAADLLFPPERVCVVPGITHNALARDERVYAQLRTWLSG